MADQAMAFYHNNGLVPTWHLAQKYLGGGGRIATVPDIIDARLATKLGETPWESYFTTLSAEYVGIGRSGRRVIIVAHGIGPMSSLDGIMAAYKHQYADKSRNNRGGRITQEEFRKLEDGEYGDVFIVDYDDYVSRYEYPFGQLLRSSEALADPLLQARLGGERRARDYILLHAHLAREANLTTDGLHPFVIEAGDANNCSYEFHPLEEGVVLAHLLSISRLGYMHHNDRGRYTSLSCDISCHEWGNGCRFAAIPDGAEATSIHPGWDLRELMRDHWRELMVVLPKPVRVGLRPIMQFGDAWFTMYPVRGHSMASWEPEFLITGREQFGEPVEFVTEIHGYYMFFRYDVQEVRAIAPPGANAFFMGDPEMEGEKHKAPVTFYRVEVDTSQRLRRADDLEGDYATQRRLAALG